VATLLKYTAVSGLGVGAISLMTAFFQAADDYSCLAWLGAGLAGYVAALLGGWQVDGITGLAAGGALGTALAAVLLGGRLARRQGYGVLARIPALELAAAAGLLVACRPHPLLWLAAAALTGVRAGARFLRPGARHAAGPRWAAPPGRRSSSRPAVLPKPETTRRRTAAATADGT
jgi:hypothetical protein